VAAGPLVDQLEAAFSRRLGGGHAVAVSSGTSALHLALLALDIGPGDDVIVPSYACATLLHAVHYTGASPVPCDLDPDTLNPTVREIRPLLTRRTRAIVVTHTFGFPADLSAIVSLGVPVIEDCAQALGAEYRGGPVGSFGRIAVCSFYATKVICSGEGGMVWTRSARLAARLRDLNRPDQRPDYKVRYNYKLSDLAAGLALRQVERLDELIERRRTIAARYSRALKPDSLQVQVPLSDSAPIYYRFVIRTRRAGAFIERAVSKGVRCDRPVFRPLHAYLKLAPKRFPHTEAIWRNGVSIPLYPSLTDAEVKYIVTVLQEAVSCPSLPR